MQGLNINNLAHRQQTMHRKLNEAVAIRKQKEQKLADLHRQLEVMLSSEKQERLTHKEIDAKTEVKFRDLHSPEKMFSIKAADQLMDIKALNNHFDYSNLDSIYETKQVLVSKLSLVE